VDVKTTPLALDKKLPATPVSTKVKAKAKAKRAKG
jgi:hypothetical protein